MAERSGLCHGPGCGKLLFDWSPSPDFCSHDCQERWHADANWSTVGVYQRDGLTFLVGWSCPDCGYVTHLDGLRKLHEAHHYHENVAVAQPETAVQPLSRGEHEEHVHIEVNRQPSLDSFRQRLRRLLRTD